MSPLIFTPTPLPKDPGDWLLLVWLVAIALILDRRGEPRSVMLWVASAFLVGMVYGGGHPGGFAGSLVGLALGLTFARVGRVRSD